MLPKEFFANLCQRLVAHGIIDVSQLRGFSEVEISEVESRTKMRLPEYYREFLRVMGKKGGGFMKGSHLFPQDVDDIVRETPWAIRMMARCKAEEVLPESAFVFGHHQGYQFWYFLTEPPNDDPPVFYYRELTPHALKIDEQFSGFLTRMAESDRAERERVRKIREEVDMMRKKSTELSFVALAPVPFSALVPRPVFRPHFFSRHGANTTIEQQFTRAKTGLTPDGVAGNPQTASRFYTNQLQIKAVNRATAIFKQTGNSVFDFDMGVRGPLFCPNSEV